MDSAQKRQRERRKLDKRNEKKARKEDRDRNGMPTAAEVERLYSDPLEREPHAPAPHDERRPGERS
jgi:hypothetical protein